MDDVKTVSYLSRTGHNTFAPAVTVTDALRRAIDKDDTAHPPESLSQQRVTWHLWRAKIGVTVPKTTDVIVDGAARWVVVAATTTDEGERYRLECVKER